MFDKVWKDLEFFHVGFVVPDLDQAKEMYGAAFGFHWCMDAALDQQIMTPEGEVQVAQKGCVSIEGPPYLELLYDGGAIWDNPKYKLNHIGFWAEDADAVRATLASSGLGAVIYDRKHESPLFSYHRGGDGLWIEVLTSATREPMLEQIRLAQEKLTEGSS